MSTGELAVRPDGTVVAPLKRKYTEPKTKGRYKSGSGAAGGSKKRHKTGKKSYVYGSRVMRVSATGKKTMEAGPA